MSVCLHPGRLDDGQCVSGKRVYYAARLANRAITEAAKRGELPTMRHYECPQCGWWHLSRKDRPPRVACPHCGLPWEGHICPDRDGWTVAEKDEARALMRREDPGIRFAPSTEEMARRFGHLARLKKA